MRISKPFELKDKDKTVENLRKLDFIEIEPGRQLSLFWIEEHIIRTKRKEGKIGWLKYHLDMDWIGSIIQNKKTGKYSFCNDKDTLKDVLKLDDWDKIKAFMGCLS